MPGIKQAGRVTETALTHFLRVQREVADAEFVRRSAAVTEAEANRARDQELFNSLLDRLVAKVADGYLDKIDHARREGLRSAELFDFEGDERFEDTDYSLLFLTKGPRKAQADFFLRLNVMPFIPRLFNVVHPYNADLTYLPESNLNIVSISW